MPKKKKPKKRAAKKSAPTKRRRKTSGKDHLERAHASVMKAIEKLEASDAAHVRRIRLALDHAESAAKARRS